MHMNRLFRRARAPQLLRLAIERPQRVLDLLRARRGPPREPDARALEVAVEDRDAVAVRRDLHGMLGVHVEGGLVVRQAAEDLGELPFDLLLFFADVGNDVVEDVERGDAGVTRAGDGLHRRDHDGLERSEGLLERVKGDGDTRRRAVGVGDDETLGVARRGFLVGEDGKVGGVDEGDDEGNEGVAAEVAGIREDGVLGFSERFLCKFEFVVSIPSSSAVYRLRGCLPPSRKKRSRRDNEYRLYSSLPALRDGPSFPHLSKRREKQNVPTSPATSLSNPENTISASPN